MEKQKYNWKVETKSGQVFCECKGHNYADISEKEFNFIKIYYETCNRQIHLTTYPKTSCFQYNNYEDKITNNISAEITLNNKTYNLAELELIASKPIFYKNAYSDFSSNAELLTTEVTGYFCGFDNVYKLEGKEISIKIVVGLSEITNVISKNKLVDLNIIDVMYNTELDCLLNIKANDELLVTIAPNESKKISMVSGM